MVFPAGVKLDFRHFLTAMSRPPRDVEAELKRIGHTLAPLDIVVVNTSAGEAYGRPTMSQGLRHGPRGDALSARRGVRVTGTDGWSWDAPFIHTRERYSPTTTRA